MSVRFFLSLLLLTGLPLAQALAQPLIMPDEAALPPPGDDMVQSRGLTRGPGIELASSDGNGEALVAPFSFKVRFVPRNAVPVDPGSVKVTYLRQKLVDISSRLRAATTPAGIELDKAEAPPGTHLLRIDVRDAQGRNGSAIVRLVVRAR